MKKLIPVLFLFLATSLSAQNMRNSFSIATEQNKIKSKLVATTELVDSIYYWHWDSNNSTLVAGNRTYLTYDANNNVSIEIWQFYDSNGAWTNNNKFIYTYDANNNEINKVYLFWNATQGIWENYSNFTSTYDSGNNMIEQESQYWDGNMWNNNAKYIYNRDSNHNMILLQQFTWDGTIWANYFESYHDFDTINNETHAFYRHWDGTTWINDSQDFTNYDSNNNRTYYLLQYPVDSITWIDYSQRNYTYNNNLLQDEEEQIFTNSSWQNNYRSDYFYDANGILLNSVIFQWDGTAYVNATQYINTVDANNNITEVSQQYWINNSWKEGTFALYEFDADHFQFANSMHVFDTFSGNTVDADSTHYYYRNLVGINESDNQNIQISISPNPSNGKINIQNSELINSVEVYNITGENVYTDFNVNSASADIDISENAKGIYLLKVYYKKKFTTKKFILN